MAAWFHREVRQLLELRDSGLEWSEVAQQIPRHSAGSCAAKYRDTKRAGPEPKPVHRGNERTGWPNVPACPERRERAYLQRMLAGMRRELVT